MVSDENFIACFGCLFSMEKYGVNVVKIARNGVMIFNRKGDFCIIKSDGNYYISVLFPNFYRNSHFDVSKDFSLDIHSLIENREFDKLTLLAEDIRMNYDNYKDKEVEEVEIVKKELVN